MGTPHFGTTKFYLSSIFTYLKIFMSLAYMSKKFKVWRTHLRGNPPSQLSRFLLGLVFIFNIYPFRKFDPSCSVVFNVFGTVAHFVFLKVCLAHCSLSNRCCPIALWPSTSKKKGPYFRVNVVCPVIALILKKKVSIFESALLAQ